MPRRRRFSSYRVTSFYLPVEYNEIAQKAEELTQVEGISFSELILNALEEYVNLHYPGNPQTILPSLLDPNGLKPLRLEAKFLFKDFQRVMMQLEDKIEDLELGFRRELRHKAIEQMNKLARMNRRLKDRDIDEFIDKACKILDAGE